VLGRNLMYSDRTAYGMMTHGPSNTPETHATEATMITKDATSVLKGLAQRRSEVPYTRLNSQSIFERQTTSSSTIAKLTRASSWRPTTSHAERVE
jgi:hypothetical protein